MKASVTLAAGLVLGLCGTAPSSAQPYNYNLSGASAGGLWTTVGTAVDKAIRAAYPGSSITYQTSGGGFANVGIVTSGKAHLGIAQDAELRLAVQGQEPFRTPVTGMRAIAVVYDFAPLQMLLTKSFAEKHGIATLEDIAQKKPPIRVILNKRGNVVHDLAKAAFEASGFTLDDIKKWGGEIHLAASQEGSDLMRDRRADLSTNAVFIGNSALLETSKAISVVMMPMSETAIRQVAERLGSQRFVIKAGAYDWVPKDVPTVTLSALLFVDQKFDDKAAYDITRGLLAQIDEFRSAHRAMQAVTPQMMASANVIPYHPGALRAFREAKLLP